jgi:hypothetical protein
MYLPNELLEAKILITVKTYPLPNNSFGETVCTAGLFEGKKWVRIYPISWNVLKDNQKYPKYGWIKLNLLRNTTDFRQESYKPKNGFDEDIQIISKLGTKNAWAARKQYVLSEVFTSMEDLIEIAKGDSHKSLATIKPSEIIDFKVENEDEKDWNQNWLAKLQQPSIFDLNENGTISQKATSQKLPFIFKYIFRTNGDKNNRELTIQDWEIGALFWNCLRRANGDYQEAIKSVRKKYYDDFLQNKDVFFFLGTHYIHHRKNAPNPFIIVGVFYPPKSPQLSLL